MKARSSYLAPESLQSNRSGAISFNLKALGLIAMAVSPFCFLSRTRVDVGPPAYTQVTKRAASRARTDRATLEPSHNACLAWPVQGNAQRTTKLSPPRQAHAACVPHVVRPNPE